MDLTSPDRVAVRRHFDGARAAVRALDSHVSRADGAPATDATRDASARTALSALDDLGRALALDAVEVQRVSCPRCGTLVMPAATLCGACWNKLTPQATPKAGG